MAEKRRFVGAAGNGVVVLDHATNTVAAHFPVANYAIGVAFTSDGTRAMVTSRDDENVSIIDTATYEIVGTLSVPTDYLGAGNIALDPVNGRFYIVDWYNDFLLEMAGDGSAILRQADFGTSLWQVVVAPDGRHVYVTDRGQDVVQEIDTDTFAISRTFTVGDDPWGLDITGDGSKLVVCCEDSHQAFVIDILTGVVTPIALDATADARDVEILDEAGLAFVTGGSVTGYSGLVYAIDIAAATIVDRFDGPGTNSNVIAVQAQMHGQAMAVPSVTAVSPALTLDAYPNPFNPHVTFAFALSAPGQGSLDIHDLLGRHVRTLHGDAFPAGPQTYRWDGRDTAGRSLASGVYLVRLSCDGMEVTRRIVLAR